MNPLSATANSLVLILTILSGATLAACHNTTAEPSSVPRIGDTAALDSHTSQDDIESGSLTLDQIVERGEFLFTTSFNTLDGAGRPETTDVSPDNFRPARTFPDNFNRISGPDATPAPLATAFRVWAEAATMYQCLRSRRRLSLRKLRSGRGRRLPASDAKNRRQRKDATRTVRLRVHRTSRP